jgi:Phosphotransferase enzyme family
MKEFLDHLVSPQRRGATEALRQLKERKIAGDKLTAVISNSLYALDSAPHISASEKRWRLAALCLDLDLSAAQVSSIVANVSGLSPGMRLAFAGVLPATLRPSVYNAAGSGLSHAEPDRLPSPPAPASLDAAIKTVPPTDDYALDVVVLTTGNDAAINLLRSSGFSPLVINTRADLDQLLQGAPDICGFIVDGSFWAKFKAADDQRDLVRTIARFSTFAWLRIDTTNLCISESEIANQVCAATANHQNASIYRLSLQSGNDLKQTQVAWLEASRNSLIPDKSYNIAPGEVDTAELRLLQCALRAALYPRLGTAAPIRISPVRASFFTGGRTDAKVAKILFGSPLQPVVAKIDTKDLILQEADRFNHFIRPWDNNLDPKVYVHGSIGVIVFDLVADRVKPDTAAPMLEKRLEQLWSQDLWTSFATEESGEAKAKLLAVGLQNAVVKLGRLNRLPNTNSKFPNYSSPYLKGVKSLEVKGRSWGLDASLLSARDRAEVQLKQLEERAVVHGDIHVRNVLLRDDSEAFFIDYASSGPGHPCSDLVRLDLSMFFAGFRPLADDRTIAALQCDISVRGLEQEALKAKYSSLLSFPSNALCLETALRCRKEALEVLKQYGGTLADYLACKYLFAWMSLQIASLPTALCRAVIEGIGPHIA